VDDEIRQVIPAEELDMTLDNIGMPNSGINLAFGDNPVLGNGDGDILVALKPKHGPTAIYNELLRARLREIFPDCKFFFEAANITNQILNFGLPDHSQRPQSDGGNHEHRRRDIERYEAGVDAAFFVIQYQACLSQARSSEVVAKGDYFKAAVGLGLAVGTLLDLNNISIHEGLQGTPGDTGVRRASAPVKVSSPDGARARSRLAHHVLCHTKHFVSAVCPMLCVGHRTFFLCFR